MKTIDLLIFDLDGTLVDSKLDIANAVNFMLKEFTLNEKNVGEIYSYIGKGIEHLIRESLGKRQDIYEEARAYFKKHYKEHFMDTSVLYPGVKEILKHFQNKKKVVISNKQQDFALLTLKELAVDGYFADVLGGDKVNCVKPDPCPINETIHRLNIDKEKTMMIGDMDIDIRAGKDAGVSTCAVTYGIGKKEDILKVGPDYIIDDISQLKEIIE